MQIETLGLRHQLARRGPSQADGKAFLIGTSLRKPRPGESNSWDGYILSLGSSMPQRGGAGTKRHPWTSF